MAKAKKVRRGREVYARLLAQREREGLTWDELSARSGIPASTLQKWGPKLGDDVRPAFVEAGTVSLTPAVFELELSGGRLLRVPMRFDASALRTLLGVLDTAC